MGSVIAICTSKKKGTAKVYVQKANLIVNHGLEGDAHAGAWHRQVSLLALSKIDDFRKKGATVEYGAFGENIVVEGYDFRSLPVGSLFRCGEALLEITQIGKECHTHCAIYHQVGDCIMPREGVFARVIKGGQIKVGDKFIMIEREDKRPFQVAVITLSDKGSEGKRIDESGPAIVARLEEPTYEVVETLMIADDKKLLVNNLKRLSDQRQLDLILTTGGTGFSQRDITPEATAEVMTKNAPGIAEAIRAYSMQKTNRAMLSRGMSVIRNSTLIINLPGSPKACVECMDYLMDTLPHGLDILRGQVSECPHGGQRQYCGQTFACNIFSPSLTGSWFLLMHELNDRPPGFVCVSG